VEHIPIGRWKSRTDLSLAAYSQAGVEKLATISLASGELTNLDRSHTTYSSIRTEGSSVCYIAQSPEDFPAVFVGDVTTDKLVCSSSDSKVSDGSYSVARPVTFPTGDSEQAHGFFYSPAHAIYEGPKNELPPLLVMIHGGPTSATSNSLSFKIQYWTNRGFAVLDVNYRGSTGFGRKYREALKTCWGIADVEDCDFGVRYLIEQGLVDKNRVAIRGGSAGGFTVLAGLAHTDTFKAGTSLYGVSDLTALAADTHKFESRYLDSLIGPYPEEKELVPPSQAEMMIEKLKSNDVPVAYLAFEGEAHGFRKSETITRAFEAELSFYGSVFGFEPAEKLDSVEFL